MRKIICVSGGLLIACNAFGQQWDVGLEAGLCTARILRTGTSTRSTSYLHFGFMGVGTYISPELSIKLNDHADFSFSYQAAQNKVGVKLGGNTTETNYDYITTHTFSVGYKHKFTLLKERVRLGITGKGGIAYGYNTGGGYGSSGGSAKSGQSVYVELQPIYDASIMPPFWTPTLSAGATLGVSEGVGPAWLERVDVSLLATACLRDIYADYAKVQYKIATPSSYEEGIAQYRGRPLILSFGVKYRLFRVVRNS